MLCDTSTGGVLYGHWIDKTFFAESRMAPVDECGHDFAAKALSMRAFLELKAELG